jgi:putative heme-binding domain-containing protein
MPPLPKQKKTLLVVLFLIALPGSLTIFEPVSTTASAQRPQTNNSHAIEAGRRRFEMRCAACHGADGKGGERGPDIISTQRSRRRSVDELKEVIRKGLPAAGMPAFQLPDIEMQELVAFVRSVSAPAVESATAGDVAAGETYFFGKGNCYSCHAVNGRGGMRGPDLSELGLERTLPEIEQSLRAPSARIAAGFRLLTARLRDGRSLRGFVKNESNYDLQLQNLDGKLHLLRKEEIDELVRESGSLMPDVKASESEMRDLIAFLSRLAGRPAADSSFKTESSASEMITGPSFTEIVEPKSGDWPTYHGRLSGNRHSELRQIQTDNVSQLAP